VTGVTADPAGEAATARGRRPRSAPWLGMSVPFQTAGPWAATRLIATCSVGSALSIPRQRSLLETSFAGDFFISGSAKSSHLAQTQAHNRITCEDTSDQMKQPDQYLPRKAVRERYGISGMTLWRWERDVRLRFPKPIQINGRLYQSLSALEEWERSRTAAIPDHTDAR
jgi:predicted DNA-binding transcriptional regulator AlpA